MRGSKISFSSVTCSLCSPFLVFFLTLPLFFLFGGCASTPLNGGFASYNLNGTAYTPLQPLCTAYGILCDYDTFSGTASLAKAGHRLDLKVGDTLVLVDGQAQHLHHPVDVYEGRVVVPVHFKEQFIDPVLRPAPAQACQQTAEWRIRKIVVDAGHGGSDPGAIGRSGLREKDVTLDIAKRLGSLLKAAGFEVVYTRSADRFISLEGRVDIANNSRADLFISIHANANRVRSLNGFEVYCVSFQPKDYRRALQAAQVRAPVIEGAQLLRPTLNLKTILWDMLYSANRAESMALATDICRSVRENLTARLIGIKSANFYVLKGARMPALLVEVGFLSNAEEERMIKNASYRQQLANAISEGIEDFARGPTFMEASSYR